MAAVDRTLRWSIASGSLWTGSDFVIARSVYFQRSYLGLPESLTAYLSALSIVGMIAAAIVAALLIARGERAKTVAALAVILGGANNVADRWLYGGVWDYWRWTHPFGALWWNIGDMMVVGGAFFLLWSHCLSFRRS